MTGGGFGLTAGCRFKRASRSTNAQEPALRPPAQLETTSLDFFGDAAAAPAPAATAAASDSAAPSGRQPRRRGRKGAAATVEPAADDEPAAASAAPASSARVVAEANQLRKALRIHAYGNDVPPLAQSAHQLSEAHGLRPYLYQNMMTAGYHELTRVQMQAVPALLAGRELLACAPTGSGKTAAFVVPMLQRLGSSARRRGGGGGGGSARDRPSFARKGSEENPLAVMKLMKNGLDDGWASLCCAATRRKTWP